MLHRQPGNTTIENEARVEADEVPIGPPIGQVDFGSLRRCTPISRAFGGDRGLCVDRHYIKRFLTKHGRDIRGRVLEVADNSYTQEFGGDGVDRSDVLHVEPGHRNATITADLTHGDEWEVNAFDCMICTQTLPFIFDVQDAVRTIYRILKPGGVLLATFAGISQISRYDMDRWGDYWRFTPLSVERLLGKAFGKGNVDITTYGNVLAATALLYGLAAPELRDEELDHHDPDYPVIITARCIKPKRFT